MSAPRAFALTVKDAGTGACTVLRVAPTTTAAALKQRLLSDGIAPPASRKVHLAHNGRMLQDDETLEAAGLALVPTVVMACVAPAPTPAPPAVNKVLDGWFTKPRTEQAAPAATAATASGSTAATASGPTAATASGPTAATASGSAAATAASAAAATQPPRAAAPAAALTGSGSATQLGRAAIARAWDRAFPSLRDGAAPAPAEEEEEEEEKMCRVCFCGEEEGRLFAPCRCKGTMRWVHPHCLNEWRAASVNARSFYTCEQCGYRYRTERTWLADVLQSERTVWLLSFAMLALVALAGRLVPGRPERLLFALLEWEPSAASAASWWGWWAGASERAMVALMWPGALGFGFSVADAYRLHRGIPLGQQGWLSALVLSIAANGRRISRVLVACGLLYFLGRLASRLRQRARRLLTRWGEVVLEAGA